MLLMFLEVSCYVFGYTNEKDSIFCKINHRFKFDHLDWILEIFNIYKKKKSEKFSKSENNIILPNLKRYYNIPKI